MAIPDGFYSSLAPGELKTLLDWATTERRAHQIRVPKGHERKRQPEWDERFARSLEDDETLCRWINFYIEQAMVAADPQRAQQGVRR